MCANKSREREFTAACVVRKSGLSVQRPNEQGSGGKFLCRELPSRHKARVQIA
jgi:hypothetical protein